ncbi:MAG: hypothetical protein P8X97_03410 [Candidatus Bathyarchaeota archaeon]
MKNQTKSKISSIIIALILTISAFVIILPTVTAHDPVITIRSTAYLVASPNPIGVNQQAIIVMWIEKPLPNTAVGNDIRRHDYKLTITKPDGSQTVMDWPVVSDTTSIQFTLYTPDQIGTYTLLFEYPDQVYTWNSTSAERQWTGDTFSAASKTITLTVQEEQIPAPIYSYPLPTEYWTRPIEGQNTDWWSISSNWLSGSYIDHDYQPDGAAPETPHIMWTKPIQDGGVVGGSSTTSIPGDTYYSGMAYQTRVSNPIIMHGRLYYELPFGNSGNGGGWVCVDLRPGEEIWADPTMGTGGFTNAVPEPDFGYLYDLHYENQHGTIGSGFLISESGSTWNFIDTRTGLIRSDFSVQNVPSSQPAFGQVSGPAGAVGPNGELLRYQIDLTNGWVAQWNSSRSIWNTIGFGPAESGTIDGSTPNRYDWNVSIPTTIPSGSSIKAAFPNDIMLVSDLAPAYGGGFTIWGTIDPYTVTAISLKPESRGHILWSQEYTAPNNYTREWAPYGGGADPVNRIFVMKDVEEMTFTGYSMDDGSKVWGPTIPQPDYDYFNLQSFIAYDRLYSSGYAGYVFCYSMKNGSRLWTYGNDGPGNSTDAGFATAWGNYPQFVMAIADGKIYTATYEHSPNSPHYKGMTIRAIDAYTGEEIWQVAGAGSAFEYGTKAFAIASGYAVWLNAYDMQLYTAGRGPSEITANIQNDVVPLGNGVQVEGTVLDIAAGTKQPEQAARFPNGVAAVSDDSMGSWMEYVYMNRPRPQDITGVEVRIQIVDPAGNYAWIGTTTSDSYGNYAYSFIPQMKGKYAVIASFVGSKGYYGSETTTYVTVGDTPAPYPTYPGYQGPSASEVANNVVNSLPDNPTTDQIAQAVVNAMPEYPEQQEVTIPEYTTIDIVLIILVAIAIILCVIILLRKK